MDSTTSSATKRSFNNLSVQRLRPSGASLHASAMIRASAPPSNSRYSRSIDGLRWTAASNPSSTNGCRTRSTVLTLTSANSAAHLSVHAGHSAIYPFGARQAPAAVRSWSRGLHRPAPAVRTAPHLSNSPKTSASLDITALLVPNRESTQIHQCCRTIREEWSESTRHGPSTG
jgi:hypothetical protein